MKILDAGAGSVWPKLLTCRNCGCEVLVETFGDLLASLPGAALLAGVPGGFQFGCPNACGAVYVAQCPLYRQLFHHAPHVHFGGEDVTAIRAGARRIDPKRRQLRRALRRRFGGSDGSVPAAR